MLQGLLKNARIYPSTGVVVTGATDKFSAIVDMREAQSCLFLIQGTTLATGATTAATGAFRIQGGPNNSTVGMVNISGQANQTTAGVLTWTDAGVADNFDRVNLAVDVHRIMNRFVSSSDGTLIRFIRGLASNSSNLANIVAIAYNMRVKGTTDQGSAGSTFFSTGGVNGTTTVLAAASS